MTESAESPHSCDKLVQRKECTNCDEVLTFPSLRPTAPYKITYDSDFWQKKNIFGYSAFSPGTTRHCSTRASDPKENRPINSTPAIHKYLPQGKCFGETQNLAQVAFVCVRRTRFSSSPPANQNPNLNGSYHQHSRHQCSSSRPQALSLSSIDNPNYKFGMSYL